MRLLPPLLLVIVAAASCGRMIGDDIEGALPPGTSADASADAPPPGVDPDAGPMDATTQVEADAPTPQGPTRLVFVSKRSTTGNLDFQNGMLGVPSADAECQAEANQAGVTAPFVAWLSTSETNAIDRLTEGPPWALRNGTIVFASRAAVAASTPQVELDLDANGEPPVPNRTRAWTGTLADGTRAPFRCVDWKSATTAQGHVGVIGIAGPEWTDSTDPTCDTPFHVICFEK